MLGETTTLRPLPLALPARAPPALRVDCRLKHQNGDLRLCQEVLRPAGIRGAPATEAIIRRRLLRPQCLDRRLARLLESLGVGTRGVPHQGTIPTGTMTTR